MNLRNVCLSQLLLKHFIIPTEIKLLLFSEKNFHISWGMSLVCTIFKDPLLNILGSFDCTCKNGKTNTAPIKQGAMYAILSFAKSRDKLQLVNFESA